MSRNLISRILVAAVAIPAILWICYQGGWWLFGMTLLFAVGALTEYLINEGVKPNSIVFWIASVTLLGTFWFEIPVDTITDWTPFIQQAQLYLLVGCFLILTMGHAVGKQPPAELFNRQGRIFWGVCYICLLYPFMFRVGSGIGGHIGGGDWLLLLFGILWVGDTAAMGVGSWLGKHKLAPSVSPNKTVEGFIGGIIGAVVVALIIAKWRLPSLTIIDTLIIAVGCSVFGQLGDLVESMWKRSLGIKDSSAIIPGHGGLLDRFDSLLFAAPFMYLYQTFL